MRKHDLYIVLAPARVLWLYKATCALPQRHGVSRRGAREKTRRPAALQDCCVSPAPEHFRGDMDPCNPAKCPLLCFMGPCSGAQTLGRRTGSGAPRLNSAAVPSSGPGLRSKCRCSVPEVVLGLACPINGRPSGSRARCSSGENKRWGDEMAAVDPLRRLSHRTCRHRCFRSCSHYRRLTTGTAPTALCKSCRGSERRFARTARDCWRCSLSVKGGWGVR